MPSAGGPSPASWWVGAERQPAPPTSCSFNMTSCSPKPRTSKPGGERIWRVEKVPSSELERRTWQKEWRCWQITILHRSPFICSELLGPLAWFLTLEKVRKYLPFPGRGLAHKFGLIILGPGGTAPCGTSWCQGDPTLAGLQWEDVRDPGGGGRRWPSSPRLLKRAAVDASLLGPEPSRSWQAGCPQDVCAVLKRSLLEQASYLRFMNSRLYQDWN